MNKVNKYNNYIYRALQIFIGIDIIRRCKDDISILLIFGGLFLLLIINDELRRRYFYKTVKRYYSSILLSMVIPLVLEISVGGYIDIYFYIILYELILFNEGKISKIFIGLQLILCLSLIILRISYVEDILTIEFWQANILDIAMVFITLFFYGLCLWAYKTLRKEKLKVDKLNKELELSYEKLKKQSEKIEELTITKERNRLAGEIHDNLGHGLIALNMNLDVAEKIIDKDVQKAKELIRKSQDLTKENMDNLRKAVYALKEERPRGLKESIERIVDNIQSAGRVDIELNIDEESENLPLEYKEIIYSTVKEGLTNSIKHGRPDKIRVDICKREDVRLVIEDNGIGCDKLIKGNGLLGIENRVAKYNGQVSFCNEVNEGFKLELVLPI